MRVWRRELLLLVTLATAATPALGQTVAPAVGPTNSGTQTAASFPDFSGIWDHPFLPGLEPPLSGAGPVVNKSRRRQVADADGRPVPATNGVLVSNPNGLVGDYTNPILKPEAAEVVKRRGEAELSGVGYPTPRNQCWLGGVPFIFSGTGIQMLQQPDKVTILYNYDHEARHVRMNQPHPARVSPSWYGDSVGHYEGDTLVIDTVGVKVGPFAMVDWYGTPHTPALHVVERYRLLDYEAAREALERDAKENFQVPGIIINVFGLTFDPNYKGKHLQLQFTVEDEGVFTMPWSATVTYRPASGEWTEHVCADNTQWSPGKNAAVPTADEPDF
jgi:hypothetical protein